MHACLLIACWHRHPPTLCCCCCPPLQRKPWGEMLDRTSFSKPGTMQEAYSRLRRNAGYFRVNYLVIAVLTIAGSFITHPSSLLVLAGLLALWVYMFAIKQGPMVLGDKEFRWVQTVGAREQGRAQGAAWLAGCLAGCRADARQAAVLRCNLSTVRTQRLGCWVLRVGGAAQRCVAQPLLERGHACDCLLCWPLLVLQ